MNIPFQTSIILTLRGDILDAIRQELKELGISDIVVPEGTDRCMEAFLHYPGALLILDWAYGQDKALRILEATKNPQKLDNRPIFLFSIDAIPQLEGVAAEFLVSRLYMGPITRNLIGKMLREICQEQNAISNDIRDLLRVVGQAREMNDWQEAEELLANFQNQNPGNPRVLIELAESKFTLGKIEETQEFLLPLISEDQPNIRALNLYGRCQMTKGLHREASITLQRAKLINPFNIDRLINLGEAFLMDGQLDRAKDNFTEAIKIEPKNQKAIGGVGKSLLLGDDINEALVYLKQLSGPKEMASVFNSAAVLSMINKKMEDGMNLYHIALETVGTDPKILSKLGFNMGIGFHRHEMHHRALECFGLASKLDSQNQKAKENFELLSRKLEKVNLPTKRKDCIARLLEISSHPTAIGSVETSLSNAVGFEDESYEDEV